MGRRQISWIVGRPEDLGRALCGVRHARGMTQEDLAHASGIDRTYLARMEAGMSTIQIERALRALRRMGATITVTLPEDQHDQA